MADEELDESGQPGRDEPPSEAEREAVGSGDHSKLAPEPRSEDAPVKHVPLHGDDPPFWRLPVEPPGV